MQPLPRDVCVEDEEGEPSESEDVVHLMHVRALPGTPGRRISPGRLDRSPCGTVTSARLALLHARGELKPGELFRHESIIGSRFDARIEGTATVGPYPAVIPAISGRAWITSLNQLVLDPTDPFQEGFVVGKTWESEY